MVITQTEGFCSGADWVDNRFMGEGAYYTYVTEPRVLLEAQDARYRKP
jgi:hypothetical protein